jgi:hypothetical protein
MKPSEPKNMRHPVGYECATDDVVTQLPVRFKEPPGGDDRPMLKVVDSYGGSDGCNHRYFFRDGRMEHVTYLLRVGETEVECGNCHVRLDPMFVLKLMAGEETQWLRSRTRYLDEMRRLKERSRTKCMYCGQMTEISRR